MSITTKRGDDGTTELLFSRRVPKTHPRVGACGAVDELTSALGLVRVSTPRDPGLPSLLASIQKELITLMGELATDPEDLGKAAAAGFATVDSEMVDALACRAGELERTFEERFRDWSIPGEDATLCAAHLDLARSIARRAEREVAGVLASDSTPSREPLRYLNRLSDLLWLLARHENALAKVSK